MSRTATVAIAASYPLCRLTRAPCAGVDNELREAERAASALRIELKLLPLMIVADVEVALRAAVEQNVLALYVVSSRLTGRSIKLLVDFATKNVSRLSAGWGATTIEPSAVL